MGLARHAGRSGTKIRDVRTLVFVAVLHGFKRFEKCLVRIMGLLRRAAKGSDGVLKVFAKGLEIRTSGVLSATGRFCCGLPRSGFMRNEPIAAR